MIDSTDSRHPVNDLFTQYNKTIFLERMMKLLCDAWTGLFLLESFLIRQFTYRSENTDSYPVVGLVHRTSTVLSGTGQHES